MTYIETLREQKRNTTDSIPLSDSEGRGPDSEAIEYGTVILNVVAPFAHRIEDRQVLGTGLRSCRCLSS